MCVFAVNVEKVRREEVFVQSDRKRDVINLFFFGFQCGFDKLAELFVWARVHNNDLAITLLELFVVGNQTRSLSLAKWADHAVEALGENEDDIFFTCVIRHLDFRAVFVGEDQFADGFG